MMFAGARSAGDRRDAGPPQSGLLRSYGGAMRDRTADLLNANQALSQLSYSPMIRGV
jgi:hypothetical protein